ncbi:MAG: ABC transporter substrate-binding protein [Deltaproteobacteria bacterium]|nr:ABC transporter substrate-binding protein [Deltaproteobacteria bacterium]
MLLVLMVFYAAFCCVGTIGAADMDPYRIGFVGGLTGRSSDLGIQGRNGAMLAVEEINQQGGINGRPLKLITKDDKQDPQTALKVDRELIDEKVIAIIGHMTSAMSEAAVPLMNQRKILMISPTTSTNKLTGIDDYFLRVIDPNTLLTNIGASYAFEKTGLRRVAAVYDLSNRTYSEEFIANFKSKFERLGGQVVSMVTFTAGPGIIFKNLVQEVLRTDPDGIIIAASAIDTAMICQHVRMTGSKIPIFISGWAQTPDLLHHGGPAVEGAIGTMYQDLDSQARPFVAFKDKFKTRFGGDGPTFAAIFSYDAVMVLKESLYVNPDPQQLKETILKQKTFQGLQGTFEIDSYGDARRKVFVITISNNRFKAIEQ